MRHNCRTGPGDGVSPGGRAPASRTWHSLRSSMKSGCGVARMWSMTSCGQAEMVRSLREIQMPTLGTIVVHGRVTDNHEYQYQFTPKHHGAVPKAAQWLPSL